MATATTTLARSDAVGDICKACVVCKTYQPRNGRFLSCLHVLCSGCLAECTSRDGSISCLLCASRTVAKIAGVELAKQLANSSDLLFGEEEAHGHLVSTGDGSRQVVEPSFCEICNDNEMERIASHECMDCDFMPLCDSHAEKHPMKRRYSGHRVHVVREGQNASSPYSSSASSKCCVYHGVYSVVTYCQTCSRCICAACIAVGSHEEHVMESIASAAAKQRARVADVCLAAGFAKLPGLLGAVGKASSGQSETAITTATTLSTHSPTTGTATVTTRIPDGRISADIDDVANEEMMAPDKLLAAIEMHIAMVTEEACVASKMATERFDMIEESVKRQRERILHAIDHRLWTQLETLEGKKRRLESLLQRQATVVDVITRLFSPAVCSESVLQMVDTVLENVLSVYKDLQAEQTLVSPEFVFVEPTPLDDFQDQLQHVVRLADGVRMDISKATVQCTVQCQEVQAGHQGCILVKLCDSDGCRMPSDQPVPDISLVLILPSGSKQAIQVSNVETNSSQLVIPISAVGSGDVQLELSYHGTSFRSTIRTYSGVFFDPHKCHKGIILSDNNRIATRGPCADAPINVLATVGYTSGRHRWSVRVLRSIAASMAVIFGVTSSRSDGHYSGDEGFFVENISCRAGWNAYGSAHRSQPSDLFSRDDSSRMKRVLDGDILAFTLDCDAHTLQCLNQRTAEAKEITGIDCSNPLYPAVCMLHEGLSVEILPQDT